MSRKTRKLIWSAPLVAVLAVAGALAIFAALAPGAALAHDAPGAPTGLMATPDADGTITLKWAAPTTGGAPTHYRIDYLSNGTGRIWRALPTDGDITDTTYVDMDLGDDTGRDYRVFAINSHGTSPVSAVAGATIPGGGVPGDVITFGEPVTVGATQLDLSWTAPAKDGGKPITSYRIHMATTSATIPVAATAPTMPAPNFATATTAVIDTGSAATTYSVKGLRANTHWYFVVYARNKNGPSANASPERHQITGPAGKPGAPTGLVAVYDAASTQTLLYWLAPASDGGSDITNYRVEVRKRGKNWPQASELAADNGALNTALGESDGNGAINTAPADGVIDLTHRTPNANDTFEYQVRAMNGTVDASNEMRSDPSAMATAKAATNNAPGAPQSLVQDTTKPNGRKQVNMVWDEPTTVAPGSGYRIDYSTDDGESWMALEPNTNFTDLRYSHESDELRPGTEYSYRVFNIKAGITGQASEILSTSTAAAGAPGAPTDLVATVKNGGQIDLTWKAPKDDGGAAITKYQVHVTSGDTNPKGTDAPATAVDLCDAGVETAIETKDDDTSYTLKGLCAQVRYNIGIVTVNALAVNNESGISNVANVVTDSMSKPGDPMGLVAESARDSNLTSGTKRGVLLIWNAPPDPYGGAITEYEIDWKLADATDWSDLVTLTGRTSDDRLSTYYTHEDEPAADEKRTYRVKAVANPATAATDKRSSEWVEVSYDLLGTPDHSHTPGMPQNVSAMVDADDATTINVTWEAAEPHGSAVTGYMVQSAYEMSDGTMSAWTNVSPAHSGMAMMYEDMGLMPETKYYYRVRAMNANGYGEYSDGMAYAMTGMGALGKPMNVMAMVEYDRTSPNVGDHTASVTVTWDDGANADVHHVFLIDLEDFPQVISERVAGDPSAETTTFSNVASGTYVVAVQSTLGEEYDYDLYRNEAGRVQPLVVAIGQQ